MSRMTPADMMRRATQSQPQAAPAPVPQAKGHQPQPGNAVRVPKGGEVHVRKIDNGHIAVVRDSSYNTVSETFMNDPGQLRLE